MIIYISIFICKIIEDALSTLRIIIVSNGKKILGAILQFIIALIWVFITGSVIINVQEDPLKILFFALGALAGSYIGSYIEEKIALGTNIFMVELNKNIVPLLTKKLNKSYYKITKIKSSNEKDLLMIASPRKKTNDIINIIKTYDKSAVILEEKVKISK